MKATKRERNKISKYLWCKGHGSRHILAKQLGFEQSELTRLLKGGTISEAKLQSILQVIESGL